MNIVAIMSMFWASALGGSLGDSYEPVSEILPHVMVTAEEIAEYDSPGFVYHIRVFSYSNYPDIDRECRYDYCKDNVLLVVVHDVGEAPIYVILQSPAAYSWRNVQISDFATDDGLRFTLVISGERDIQGNHQFVDFSDQVSGTLGGS